MPKENLDSMPKKKIKFGEIEMLIKGAKDEKPPSVIVSDEQWAEALDGHYQTFLMSGACNQFADTAQFWSVIFFSAMAFCRGMERQQVIDGKIQASYYPRY